MKIEPLKITVKDLVKGYKDNKNGGVVGYDGKLDIRPPYQREFIYKDEQRDAVIHTVDKGYPLNVMYWAVRKDGTFEVIDGQQRTISICEYLTKKFATKIGNTDKKRKFSGLYDDELKRIEEYKLMVYLCDGTDSEKMDWFRIINIAGLKLTEQELRNAVYLSPWVSDAKIYFSRAGCPAKGLGDKYLTGRANRQEYLETAIKWISNDNIEDYMIARHDEGDENADELREHFEKVIKWVKATFTKPRKEMKGVDWGGLYNKFKDKKLDSAKLETEVAKLMEDEDVSSKKGIYTFVLTGEEKNLNIRTFNDKQKRVAFERQKGFCVHCGKKFKLNEMHADHIKPWSKGGKTELKNCQMLCQKDNAIKSNK